MDNPHKPLNQNKMTAVEWLENKIKTSKYFYKLMADINSRCTIAQPSILEQAKAMEKVQIKDAYKYGIQDEYVIGAEQYYNETFKSE